MGTKEGVRLRGFYRIKLGEGDEVVGDSGWQQNEVMDLGFQDYICSLIGSLAGSKQVARMIIGTGTIPNVTDTTLNGEIFRQTCGNSVVSSKTMRSTISVASTDHPGGTPAIRNIALINDTASGGTIMAGNTYATSAWNSNQGLSATYELRFGTA